MVVRRQLVQLIKSQPILAIQVPKPRFVVIPAAVEINRAVQSLLKYRPTSTGSGLVTIHIKRLLAVRVDCVHTAASLTAALEVSTVFSIYWM